MLPSNDVRNTYAMKRISTYVTPMILRCIERKSIIVTAKISITSVSHRNHIP